MASLAYLDARPDVHESAFLADGAILVGKVRVAAEASIWFNAVLRGDEEPIRIGKGSNIQDGAVLHTDPGCPCTVGEYVTVGHNAILHGCLVDRGATIGMGATVLNRARVGEESLVAANALVLEHMEIPPRTLAAGVPARVRRELTEEEIADFRKNTDGYVRRRGIYLGLDSRG
ncbi:MAG: gamma carbonic anhydrase family protein [Gemmatimonadota bacterium]|nr:gamma carbonic anhydrase family protein [Gemmatimonadota bacterium]